MNLPKSPPPRLSGVAAKIITAYAYWSDLTRHIPKMRRYSLGVKIDQLFTELIALVTETQFSQLAERGPLLKRTITCNDVLKNMFYVLLELKGIEKDQFVIIAPMLEEIGRILYGWKNQKPKKL